MQAAVIIRYHHFGQVVVLVVGHQPPDAHGAGEHVEPFGRFHARCVIITNAQEGLRGIGHIQTHGFHAFVT